MCKKIIQYLMVLSIYRIFTVSALVYVLVFLGCTDPEAVIIPSDEEPTELEGVWNGYELEGIPGIWSLTFNGNLLTASNLNNQEWYKAVFELKSGNSAKNIDLKYAGGSDTSSLGDTARGIYKTLGDTLTMALGPTFSDIRPTNFSPNKNSRVFISIKKKSSDTMGYSCPDFPTLYYAGRTYTTVRIGSQCWLRQNLNIGNTIKAINNSSPANDTTEKYCYNDDPYNCLTYGGLYQWSEAMKNSSSEGVKGICPTGWHIPTYDDFQKLISYVNNDAQALKAPGASSGTNASGFSALFSGCRNLSGSVEFGGYAAFWTSSIEESGKPYAVFLYQNSSRVTASKDYSREYGFSVRCVLDD